MFIINFYNLSRFYDMTEAKYVIDSKWCIFYDSESSVNVSYAVSWSDGKCKPVWMQTGIGATYLCTSVSQ